MAAAIEDDLADRLDGIGGLVSGTNLFRGPVLPVKGTVPAAAVFVLPTGGPAPEHYRGPTEVRRRACQVRVRSEPRKYFNGLTTARLVLARLHRSELAGYLQVEVTSSEPLYLGEDEAGSHEWSINVVATIDE